MSTNLGTATVDASPTKEFFVEMLTRDIRMSMAILDLIDNCVDGALRIREDASLEGLMVKIVFTESQFLIQDNCGGIPLDLAKNYAFRFGRPKNAPSVKHSVGRFGVGMKRALFKLGRHFDVRTKTQSLRYRIIANVTEWLEKDEWEFPIVEMVEFSQPLSKDDTGTEIVIENLTREARTWCALPYNINSLKRRYQGDTNAI